ncbi:hypothetical protein [Tenacibaculum sp. 190524A05c]|uniref:Immunity protein 43 of polymorphic toxin system n=1 Tax=Tenacibaculum platacis TaxID=3137852 RepID=A0ABP1EGQ3_9FLAO
MKKRYSFFAKWRKRDAEFLNNLNLVKKVKEGYDGFWVEEGEVYEKIMKKFTSKSFFSSNSKPPEFKVKMSSVVFSKEELDSANYYMLCGIRSAKQYPKPENDYKSQVFNFEECDYVRINKKQKAPFRIDKPKWKQNQVAFSLELEWDFMFFKKEFFQEVLKPIGLKYKEVLNHSTGEPLEDTVQLDIPLAESKILIENSAYDIYEPRCGIKQYARQYLDFFPPFEKEFNFHICHTQEEFDGGFKRSIISKEFCQLLLTHKLIKYNSDYLIPMKIK